MSDVASKKNFTCICLKMQMLFNVVLSKKMSELENHK